MDEESTTSRFWCHMCSQIVNPVAEADVKCPHCDGGFLEEMSPGEWTSLQTPPLDASLSPWASVLLGMLGSSGSLRRRRPHRVEGDGASEQQHSDDSPGSEEAAAAQRRQRSSAAIIQQLQALGQSDSGDDDGEREHVLFIDPFDHAIVLQASTHASRSRPQGGGGVAFGDYFLGPSLDLLLQQLAENDPSKYGTPPARKEAVEAMPAVKVGEGGGSCSVCLEDFEPGAEAREMPCKHAFHGGCILPWLELHSSCPMCRFQLPADESKVPDAGGSGDGGSRANGRRFRISRPLFGGLFSSWSSAAAVPNERTGDGDSATAAPPESNEN